MLLSIEFYINEMTRVNFGFWIQFQMWNSLKPNAVNLKATAEAIE
mgnify:CR=1 FL=1